MSSFLGSFLGGLVGGGGTEIVNTSSSASDVDVEVNPVILNTIDLAPVDALVARVQQVGLDSQARSEAAFERIAAGFNDTIRLAAAVGFAWFILRKGKA